MHERTWEMWAKTPRVMPRQPSPETPLGGGMRALGYFIKSFDLWNRDHLGPVGLGSAGYLKMLHRLEAAGLVQRVDRQPEL